MNRTAIGFLAVATTVVSTIAHAGRESWRCRGTWVCVLRFGHQLDGHPVWPRILRCRTGSRLRVEYAMQVSSASAGTWKAPELDPNSAASGLALLLGGLAVLCGRREKIAA